jgi:hypothetical protein
MKKLFAILLLPSIAFCQSSLQSLINPPTSSETIWIGADVGTSIRLSKNRFLWLFGDR